MSEFSQAFAGAFNVSKIIFGDTCTIAGLTFTCVIHNLTARETIDPRLAGRRQDATGVVILSAADWDSAQAALTAQGKPTKRPHIGLPGGIFRVLNDPNPGYTTDTVELEVGPLS